MTLLRLSTPSPPIRHAVDPGSRSASRLPPFLWVFLNAVRHVSSSFLGKTMK